VPRVIDGRLFEWETHLGSSWAFWRRWGWGDRAVQGWFYAGRSLSYYLDGVLPEERIVVAHSHGGQVALHAAASGLYIHRLLTIGTPVRADMAPIARQARANIGKWWHVSDLESDPMAILGMFGDGDVGGRRTFALTAVDRNVRLEGIRHSRMLNDPKVFRLWPKAGLIRFLRSV
jgi:hypothetical protein